jgi:hypothetical protein
MLASIDHTIIIVLGKIVSHRFPTFLTKTLKQLVLYFGANT